jgi:hypothetical protein
MPKTGNSIGSRLRSPAKAKVLRPPVVVFPVGRMRDKALSRADTEELVHIGIYIKNLDPSSLVQEH